MPRPLNKLELRTEEVSIVDAGANKKKRFPIWKESIEMTEEIIKTVLDTELDIEKDLLVWSQKAKLSDKGANAVKAALRILSGFKDELPADVLTKLSTLTGFAAPEKAVVSAKKTDVPADADKEPVTKALEGLPSEIRKQLDDQNKAHEQEIALLRDNNECITKALAVEKDARELAEWTEKSRTDLSHFPGKSTDEIAASLLAMHKLSPEVAQSQFDSMKAASAALKESQILKSSGGNAGSVATGSAWEEIEKLANGLVEKSSDVSLTHADAVQRVLSSDKGAVLYDRYNAEQESANR